MSTVWQDNSVYCAGGEWSCSVDKKSQECKAGSKSDHCASTPCCRLKGKGPKLTSKSINLSQYNNVRLQFWWKNKDKGRCKAYVSNGGSYSQIWERTSSGSGTWTSGTLNSLAYKSSVRIRFEALDEKKTECSFDNVKILATRPTPRPTKRPTPRPTPKPTKKPTQKPTRKPTKKPTSNPSTKPTTERPTKKPTKNPTTTLRPTKKPSKKPTLNPTGIPTGYPTIKPSMKPSYGPTEYPSLKPTEVGTTVAAVEGVVTTEAGLIGGPTQTAIFSPVIMVLSGCLAIIILVCCLLCLLCVRRRRNKNKKEKVNSVNNMNVASSNLQSSNLVSSQMASELKSMQMKLDQQQNMIKEQQKQLHIQRAILKDGNGNNNNDYHNGINMNIIPMNGINAGYIKNPDITEDGDPNGRKKSIFGQGDDYEGGEGEGNNNNNITGSFSNQGPPPPPVKRN